MDHLLPVQNRSTPSYHDEIHEESGKFLLEREEGDILEIKMQDSYADLMSFLKIMRGLAF